MRVSDLDEAVRRVESAISSRSARPKRPDALVVVRMLKYREVRRNEWIFGPEAYPSGSDPSARRPDVARAFGPPQLSTDQWVVRQGNKNFGLSQQQWDAGCDLRTA